MAPRRLKGAVALLAGLAFVQVVFEDVIVFSGLTDGSLVGSRVLLTAVPLLVVLVILAVVLGGAIWGDESLR